MARLLVLLGLALCLIAPTQAADFRASRCA